MDTDVIAEINAIAKDHNHYILIKGEGLLLYRRTQGKTGLFIAKRKDEKAMLYLLKRMFGVRNE